MRSRPLRPSSLTAAALLGAALALPATAADLSVSVELPRLPVAEYLRPYTALWIEREDHSVAANLAVWYDVKKPDNEGEKWLKDMRQWWRRSGRAQQMPIDGVSGATRTPGRHTLSFSSGKAPLGDLAAGNYRLVVEAVREVGGRELVEIPFQWPPKSAQKLENKGRSELGTVALELKP